MQRLPNRQQHCVLKRLKQFQMKVHRVGEEVQRENEHEYACGQEEIVERRAGFGKVNVVDDQDEPKRNNKQAAYHASDIIFFVETPVGTDQRNLAVRSHPFAYNTKESGCGRKQDERSEERNGQSVDN